jgi:hypothetical protein
MRRGLTGAAIVFVLMTCLLFLGRYVSGKDFDVLRWSLISVPLALLTGFGLFRERDKL